VAGDITKCPVSIFKDWQFLSVRRVRRGGGRRRWRFHLFLVNKRLFQRVGPAGGHTHCGGEKMLAATSQSTDSAQIVIKWDLVHLD